MENKIWDTPLLISLAVGILTGFISAHTLFAHSATAIYFWGTIGLLLGLVLPHSKTRNNGLAYGFTLMLSFLLFGFQGQSDRLLAFVALAIGLSLVSAFCGWLAVFVGSRVKLFFANKRN